MTWALHHGDCLAGMATLPDKSVDVVITDPPYSEHVHAHHGQERRYAGQIRETISFAHLSADVRDAAAAHFARVARRWIVVFCDVEGTAYWREALESAGAVHARTGAWVKIAGMPQMSGDRPAAGMEGIVVAHATGTRWRWNGGGRPATWMAMTEKVTRKDHPNTKPLALMEALVRDFTDPGETILDPFAGSGTTGVAAIRLGRHFIGWEQDAKYHEVATKRLSEAREQLEIPTRKIKHKQTTLAGT